MMPTWLTFERRRIAAIVALVALIALFVAPMSASAATLTAQTITPSNTAAGATGVNYSFAGTGLTATSVDRVVVSWPSAVTKATIVAADITTLTYGATAATGISIISQNATTVTIGHTGLTPVAGTTLNLTIGGARFTNPSADGAYQWTVRTRLTSTNVDVMTPMASIGATTITVGANITNQLTFTFTNSPIALDMTPGGESVAQAATLTGTTNNAAGFTIQASTPGITRVGGGGTITANTANLASTGTAWGTPGAGALLWGVSRASAVSQACGVGGTPACSASNFWGIPDAAATTAEKTIFRSGAAVVGGTMSLSYQFQAAGDSTPGEYTATITYSAAPN
jgi:hypothetical protein